MKTLLLLICSAVIAIAADLPDPKLTPGATLDVPLAKLCTKGYATSVRNVSESTKKQVMIEYGLDPRTTHGFEIDHLVSLELSGSNDIANLWPQSYAGTWNAHVKDALEDRLHALVCAPNPTVSLRQAQNALRSDWIAEYKRIFRTQSPMVTVKLIGWTIR